MDHIAFVKETVFGTAPSKRKETVFGTAPSKRRRKKRKGSKTTYTGMRPYYRRRITSSVGIGGIKELSLPDMVKVFFRDASGRQAGVIVVEADKAQLFERGKSYTIEQEWL